MPYGILNCLLTENGPQLDPKFLAAIFVHLRLKLLTTAAYQRQTNGRVKRFSTEIVTPSILRGVLSDLAVPLMHPLTNPYHIEVHRSAGTTPISCSCLVGHKVQYLQAQPL